MKKFILSLLVCLCFFQFVQAQDNVSFVYQGRVNVPGGPYTGTGHFKFALFVKDGPTEHYLWFNDGPTSGSMPVNAISIPVENGVFSVVIGDTSLENMAALSSVLFNTDDRVWLRTWFDDGFHGFEQLNPDKRIVNPELIGISQKNEIVLYVNAHTGNDHWSGLLPGRAKKTIQAAVDALPPIIEKPATIFVADGIYRERVLLKNISLGSGDANLSLIGNTASPANVIISGADSGAPTIPVRTDGIMIEDSRGMIVKGFKFQYAVNYGIGLVRSSATVENCEAFECGQYGYTANSISTLSLNNSSVTSSNGGVFGSNNSVVAIDGLSVSNIDWHGVSVNSNSTLSIRNSSISNCGRTGIIVWTHSQGSIANCTVSNCTTADSSFWSNIAVWGVSMVKIYATTVTNAGVGNVGTGVECIENSYVEFREEAIPTINVIRNCAVGFEASRMSGATNMNGAGLNFISCAKNYSTFTDGKVYSFPPNN